VTGAAERLGLPEAWLVAAVGAACLAVGALAGVNPEYGLLAAVGLVFCGVVLIDVTIGFVLFTAVSFLDELSATGSFSGTKVIGMVVAGSWLARIATQRRGKRRSFVGDNRALSVAIGGLLMWSAISVAWAEYPSTALGGAGRYGLEMLLLPMGFAAMRERRHLIWVMGAFVFGAAFSAVYGFVDPAAIGSAASGRLTGSLGDANAEATVLAAALPMLVGLIAIGWRSARVRLLGLLGIVLLFAGLVNTVSREGLIALGAVLIASVVFGGRWRAQAAAVFVVGVAATAGYFFVLAPLAARQRVTSGDTSGRSSIWTVAFRVVADHPLLGVGTDNFILVERQYINKPGLINANFIIDEPKVAHNTYLESLVDLGIPGLVLTVAIFAFCLAGAVRAAWIYSRVHDPPMELLARSVVLAMVALFTADFFVSNQYAKFQWIVLALGPVLLRLARGAVPRIVLRPVATGAGAAPAGAAR
jgi:O-antigen ligase